MCEHREIERKRVIKVLRLVGGGEVQWEDQLLKNGGSDYGLIGRVHVVVMSHKDIFPHNNDQGWLKFFLIFK